MMILEKLGTSDGSKQHVRGLYVGIPTIGGVGLCQHSIPSFSRCPTNQKIKNAEVMRGTTIIEVSGFIFIAVPWRNLGIFNESLQILPKGPMPSNP